MQLTLKRYAYSPDSTEGRLFINGEFIAWTIERPWKNNKPNISCIPEGSEYVVRPHIRPNGDKVLIVEGGTVCLWKHELSDTKLRYLILFHPANLAHQLGGCIAPGQSRKPGRVNASVRSMMNIKGKLNNHFNRHNAAALTIEAEAPDWSV